MKYFTLTELTRSATAAQKGIVNHPEPQHIHALTALVDNILDPLRQAWGRPIYVNSGFRCPALNAAVGGSRTSQHTLGQAVDITAGTTADNIKLFRLAQRLNLPFDQLIDEKGYRWLHISFKADGTNRHQILHL